MKTKKRLEDNYSWKELGELIAKKIQDTHFLKNLNKKDFLSWFMEREKVGFKFDWRLIARAYVIWKDLRDKKDHFTVVVGKEGSGKTTISTQLSAWVAPNMDLNDIVFDMQQYINKLQDTTRHYKKNKINKNDRSIEIDEGGINLFSRESMSTSNRVLAKTFMVQRFLNVHVSINIPHYWSLDSLIRNHRINTLIIVKKRGRYECVVGKGIKILNKLGKKDKDRELWQIPIPYGYFWEGEFRKGFPNTISERKYDNHKFKHIKSFLEDAKIEAESIKMVKIGIIEKEFGLHRDTIIKEIRNNNIEGRKIGNNWFITKKAYDKLIMA